MYWFSEGPWLTTTRMGACHWRGEEEERLEAEEEAERQRVEAEEGLRLEEEDRPFRTMEGCPGWG